MLSKRNSKGTNFLSEGRKNIFKKINSRSDGKAMVHYPVFNDEKGADACRTVIESYRTLILPS